MPLFNIPSPLRNLTNGIDKIHVEGTTLRQAIAALEDTHPTLHARLIDPEDPTELRPDIAIAIDGNILEGSELVTPLSEDTEIYLVPPLGGG